LSPQITRAKEMGGRERPITKTTKAPTPPQEKFKNNGGERSGKPPLPTQNPPPTELCVYARKNKKKEKRWGTGHQQNKNDKKNNRRGGEKPRKRTQPPRKAPRKKRGKGGKSVLVCGFFLVFPEQTLVTFSPLKKNQGGQPPKPTKKNQVVVSGGCLCPHHPTKTLFVCVKNPKAWHLFPQQKEPPKNNPPPPQKNPRAPPGTPRYGGGDER